MISDEKISWEHCSNNKCSDVWIISICNCLVEYELKRREREREKDSKIRGFLEKAINCLFSASMEMFYCSDTFVFKLCYVYLF